jgi:hypothetical protein
VSVHRLGASPVPDPVPGLVPVPPVSCSCPRLNPCADLRFWWASLDPVPSPDPDPDPDPVAAPGSCGRASIRFRSPCLDLVASAPVHTPIRCPCPRLNPCLDPVPVPRTGVVTSRSGARRASGWTPFPASSHKLHSVPIRRPFPRGAARLPSRWQLICWRAGGVGDGDVLRGSNDPADAVSWLLRRWHTAPPMRWLPFVTVRVRGDMPANAHQHGCGLRGSAQPSAARWGSAVTVRAVVAVIRARSVLAWSSAVGVVVRCYNIAAGLKTP